MNPPLIRKIRKGIADHGLLIYLVYVLKTLLGHVTQKVSIQLVYLYAVPVTFQRRTKLPDSIRKNYRVVFLYQDDEILRGFPVSSQTIAYRFRQNAVCLVVLRQNEPVGFFWLIRGVYQEDMMFVDIHLGPESAWDFELFVRDEYRLSPAFSILWETAFEYLGREGVRWVYSRISTINNRSVQVHSKLGGRILSKILFLRIGGREICWDMRQRKLSLHTTKDRKIMAL